MKNCISKILVAVILVSIFSTYAVKASNYTGLREVSPQVKVEASLNKESVNKNTGVDSTFSYFRMKVKMPQKIKKGDYFNIEMRGIPSSNFDKLDIRANDKYRTRVGKIFKTEENINARNIQFETGHQLFETIKPEQSGDWRKFQVIFDEEAEKIDNINFEISFENQYQGFAVSSKEYQVPIFVKINNQEIFTDVVKIGAWGKYVYTKDFGVYEMSVDGVIDNFKSDLTSIINWQGNMSGKILRIEIEKEYPYIFTGIDGNSEGGKLILEDSFVYGDSNPVSANGLIGNNVKGRSEFRIAKISDKFIEFEILSQSNEKGVITGLGGVKFEPIDKNSFFNSKNHKTKIKCIVKNGDNIEFEKTVDADIKIKNSDFKSGHSNNKNHEENNKNDNDGWVVPLVGISVFLVVAVVTVSVLLIFKRSRTF